MEIKITKAQHDSLLDFCRSSKIEQSAAIYEDVNGNDIMFKRLVPKRVSMYRNTTNETIIYYKSQYITHLLCRLKEAKEVCVSCHTHPGLWHTANLSEADIERIKNDQAIANKWAKHSGRKVLIVEGVISPIEIAFYYYDEQEQSIKRMPLFVDEIEKPPLFSNLKYSDLEIVNKKL